MAFRLHYDSVELFLAPQFLLLEKWTQRTKSKEIEEDNILGHILPNSVLLSNGNRRLHISRGAIYGWFDPSEKKIRWKWLHDEVRSLRISTNHPGICRHDSLPFRPADKICAWHEGNLLQPTNSLRSSTFPGLLDSSGLPDGYCSFWVHGRPSM